MDNKKIKINTNSSKFFRQYIELLSVMVNPLTKVGKGDLDVLAKLIEYSYKFRNINEEYRKTLLFSRDTKKEIIDSLGIADSTFYNSIHKLRKNNLVKDNEVVKSLLVYPVGSDFNLSFNFKIIEENAEGNRENT